jgi:acyl-CoA synthetase (NDP forming)
MIVPIQLVKSEVIDIVNSQASSNHPLEEILHPQSIAVVGASDKPSSRGHSFTHHLLSYGYGGEIYPVNPKYSEILGMKAYPNLREIPGPVDYVISCVPAPEVIKMLEDCSHKGVKAVHLFTARFSETGHREAAELEEEVLKQARSSGIRLIGPNCMGLYYPREGISFAYDLPKEPGSVGLISQTGGGAAIFVNVASMRGIRFSKVISYGNALDLSEADYLDYFSQDPETKIIVMYVEGVKDAQRFFDSLRRAASAKPVIITKGGRGASGTKAAASHTASLSGSHETWETVVAQAGALSAYDFDEMADLAVSFYFLPPIQGARVGISGGGGGPSVLAADECEEAGLDVVPLPKEIREELRTKAPAIWDWVGNPTDVSILGGFGFTGIDMLKMMAKNRDFDLLIANVTEVPLASKEDTLSRLRGEVQGYIEVKNTSSKPLLVVIGEKSLGMEDYGHWRWKLTGELRSELLAADTVFYPTMKRAAQSARRLIDYYQRRG